MQYILDIEADNLYPLQKNTWTICIKQVGSDRKLTLHPYKSSPKEVREEILDFIYWDQDGPDEDVTLIGHNFLGFDGWVLWKDFDLKISVGAQSTFGGRPVTYFDTLFASQFFLPDREGGHSLENWGEILGYEKINYRQVAIDKGYIPKDAPPMAEFSLWSEEMDEYCMRDCEVCERVFVRLNSQLEEEDVHAAYRLGQKNFFLMAAQAFTGFKFDDKKAVKLKARIEEMIVNVREEVEPGLPPRKLKKSEEGLYKFPAKPFTKDGSYSAHMRGFIEKNNAKILPNKRVKIGDEIFEIVPNKLWKETLPMSLDDRDELKDYFLSIGWIPTLWNFKKDKSGKPVRDEKGKLIQTSPKIQENQVICPNLSELDGELPQKIVKFLSLRNRLSILTGWLEDPRLAWDGRLSAGSSGLANTHRQRHTNVVNVPKAQDDVLLGPEFRALFTVEKGNMLVGCDQAALEARCEAHWVYKYDGGIEAANELINGDIHSKNAKVFYPDETLQFDVKSPTFNKDDVGFKKYRSTSKNGKYALLYGASPKKLAQTLRKSERIAQSLYDAYWENNPALKALKDKIEYFWERKANKKWIPGIDGRRLYSRSKHSLVNLLFQSTGAIIVDYAICLFDHVMGGLKIDEKGRPYYLFKGEKVMRVVYSHDEIQLETHKSIAVEIGAIAEWCMAEAGERLELNIPLVGESKVGMNWSEVH